MTSPARPSPPQAAVDAAERAHLGMHYERSTEWSRQVAEAAVSAAFAAVVPADLFIAPDHGYGDGCEAIWRDFTPDGIRAIAWRRDTPTVLWALLAALIPTRDSALDSMVADAEDAGLYEKTTGAPPRREEAP